MQKTLECKRKHVLSARRHNLSENKCMEVELGGHHSGVQPHLLWLNISPLALYI